MTSRVTLPCFCPGCSRPSECFIEDIGAGFYPIHNTTERDTKMVVTTVCCDCGPRHLNSRSRVLTVQDFNSILKGSCHE